MPGYVDVLGLRFTPPRGVAALLHLAVAAAAFSRRSGVSRACHKVSVQVADEFGIQPSFVTSDLSVDKADRCVAPAAVGQPARDGWWCVFAGFGSHQCRCRLTAVGCCKVLEVVFAKLT